MSPEASAAARNDEGAATVAAARRAQAAWSDVPVRRRLRTVRRIRHGIAGQVTELAASVRLPQRTSVAETLAAEVLPLADACRFLEREASALLAPRALGRRGRPLWLGGSQVEVRREPFGVVLIIGPSNYPLLLPGVQAVQALVAGNAVLLKPGRGGHPAAARLAALMLGAGVPAGLLTVLAEAPSAAASAIDAGVDKVLLTGSAASGRAVLAQLAASATPAVMELSGCDAVFVRDDADIGLLARALAFGLTFNGSFTCIAPRRVFGAQDRLAELEARLAAELAAARAVPVDRETAVELSRLTREALAGGARLVFGEPPARMPWAGTLQPIVLADVQPGMAVLQADSAAPILSLVAVDSDEQALAIAAACPYQLGATVFGKARGARALARRVAAGIVVVNDLIVPTADPRVPFGGRGASGFGVTRGAEGLLELTRVKTVIRRRGVFRPHLEPAGPDHESLLSAFIQMAHAERSRSRLRAVVEVAKILIRQARRG